MQFNLACFICTVYTLHKTEISHFTIQKESIRVLGTEKRSEVMIRVEVNSKPELVEDREEKSALLGVICCCDDKLHCREL